uniref:Terminase large subunit n=1 Tax=Siphoviridae sp. ctxMM9 TaxID=2827973 RepID=A0A8S5T5T1_9CAUD|nr:MAG TPA: terminase large subunit [Siphoviridae sp. ctxMM9]
MEECVGIDGTILNEVIIPVMNISRRLPNNTTIDEEVLNKS